MFCCSHSQSKSCWLAHHCWSMLHWTRTSQECTLTQIWILFFATVWTHILLLQIHHFSSNVNKKKIKTVRLCCWLMIKASQIAYFIKRTHWMIAIDDCGMPVLRSIFIGIVEIFQHRRKSVCIQQSGGISVVKIVKVRNDNNNESNECLNIWLLLKFIQWNRRRNFNIFYQNRSINCHSKSSLTLAVSLFVSTGFPQIQSYTYVTQPNSSGRRCPLLIYSISMRETVFIDRSAQNVKKITCL